MDRKHKQRVLRGFFSSNHKDVLYWRGGKISPSAFALTKQPVCQKEKNKNKKMRRRLRLDSVSEMTPQTTYGFMLQRLRWSSSCCVLCFPLLGGYTLKNPPYATFGRLPDTVQSHLKKSTAVQIQQLPSDTERGVFLTPPQKQKCSKYSCSNWCLPVIELGNTSKLNLRVQEITQMCFLYIHLFFYSPTRIQSLHHWSNWSIWIHSRSDEICSSNIPFTHTHTENLGGLQRAWGKQMLIALLLTR